MGDSARRAVEITTAIQPERGALPRIGDLDGALVELRALPVADAFDAQLLRESIGEILQWRNAVVSADSEASGDR